MWLGLFFCCWLGVYPILYQLKWLLFNWLILPIYSNTMLWSCSKCLIFSVSFHWRAKCCSIDVKMCWSPNYTLLENRLSSWQCFTSYFLVDYICCLCFVRIQHYLVCLRIYSEWSGHTGIKGKCWGTVGLQYAAYTIKIFLENFDFIKINYSSEYFRSSYLAKHCNFIKLLNDQCGRQCRIWLFYGGCCELIKILITQALMNKWGDIAGMID